MIYGHLLPWMAAENPEFARAVAEHYSIRSGRKNSAVFGEIAYWQLAETLLSRAPDHLKWASEERLFFQPLLNRIDHQTRQVREAVRTGNCKYLRKLAAGLQLLAKRAQRKSEDQLEEIEYIFEAYHFLRKRDGEGSELPLKKEVTSVAAFIRAFKTTGSMGKLPKFLWDPVSQQEMPGEALTEREFSEVKRLQQHYLRRETKDSWTYWLDKAGLTSLKQGTRE